MSIGLLYDPLFLEHDHPAHPENSRRLRAIVNRLRASEVWDQLQPIAFTAAGFEDLTAIHAPAYVGRVYALAERGGGSLNPDTYLNKASFSAAALAVGASIAAAEAVISGVVQRAFALVRPPGHHAFPSHGEGFCLFNNVAFAALSALGEIHPAHDLSWSPSAVRNHRNAASERVMIVDFDVHHGNGTQAIFYDDPRVLFISVHEYGWGMYPGTGSLHERGEGAGKGTTVNIPLPAGAGDLAYAQVFDEVIAPLAERFRPQALIISAGFDAHWRDPLAHMQLSLAGFGRIIRVLRDLSEAVCSGRMVLVLEGGYDLEALSYGVLNTFRVLLGEDDIEDPLGAALTQETPIDDVLSAVQRLGIVSAF
ncbi:MAG: histone deacetylase [Thermoflexales bacterium]|nr:histone deacetylase [Thermoflexales bacterium]